MTWTRQFQLGDPAIVYERMERHAQKQAAKAIRKAQDPFGDDMGRRLDIAPHVTTALHQWGEWANRPQFWANLNVTPFCKLVGIGHGRELPEIRLDPQSMAIHKAVMRQVQHVQIVLVGYYVGGFNWDDKQLVYGNAGIQRKAFYELLRDGSISTFNSAKLG